MFCFLFVLSVFSSSIALFFNFLWSFKHIYSKWLLSILLCMIFLVVALCTMKYMTCITYHDILMPSFPTLSEVYFVNEKLSAVLKNSLSSPLVLQLHMYIWLLNIVIQVTEALFSLCTLLIQSLLLYVQIHCFLFWNIQSAIYPIQ